MICPFKTHSKTSMSIIYRGFARWKPSIYRPKTSILSPHVSAPRGQSAKNSEARPWPRSSLSPWDHITADFNGDQWIIPMTDPYVCHDHGNIYHQYIPNVGIYTIHGSYGISSHPSWRTPLKAWSNMLWVQSRRIRMYVCHDHGLPLTIKKYPIHASINLPYIRIRHGNDGGQHGPAWVTSLWDGGVFILRPWRGRSRPIGTYPPVDVYIAIISHRIHV